jgi:hypothetical protein
MPTVSTSTFCSTARHVLRRFLLYNTTYQEATTQKHQPADRIRQGSRSRSAPFVRPSKTTSTQGRIQRGGLEPPTAASTMESVFEPFLNFKGIKEIEEEF